MRDQKGITLIALIITIVVMLILVGIRFAIEVGDEGVINKASQAAEKNEEADILDKVERLKIYDDNNILNIEKTLDKIKISFDKVEIEHAAKEYIIKITGKYKVHEISIKEDIEIPSTELDELDELKGKAYAILVEDGTLYFTRSEIEFEVGNTYEGKEITNVYKVNEIGSDVPWSSKRSSIKSVIFQKTIRPISTAGWFMNMVNCKIIDLTNLDTSKVTDMKLMFDTCSNLIKINISNLDTSSVTNMSNMFSGCKKLTELNVSNFDTSKVTNMSTMFDYCEKLTELDVSNFNTSSVTNMGSMFSNCSGLTELDLSKFDTSSVTNMLTMFSNCSGLTELDVSNFDTSKVTTMYFMFNGCEKLTELNVSNFDTSNVKNMSYMFRDCKALTELDISNFNTANVTTMLEMFRGCLFLEKLIVPNNWKKGSSEDGLRNINSMSYMFYNCGTLNLDCSDWNVEGKDIDYDKFNHLLKTDLTTEESKKIKLPDAWKN